MANALRTRREPCEFVDETPFASMTCLEELCELDDQPVRFILHGMMTRRRMNDDLTGRKCAVKGVYDASGNKAVVFPPDDEGWNLEVR